jgi:Protein of unknown function (DUF3667)
MADEPAKIILGDTAISGIERTSGPRWFRRRKDKELPALSHCENCGAPLTGPHCAQCGQAAIDYRRSFRHVIIDVLDSFLNWDSKFFATIGLLIVKPWRLTNEFLAGKRVRYLHPLRLYLLASILFFFAVNYGAKGLHVDPSQLGSKDRAEIEADLQKEDLPPKTRARLERLLREPSPSPSSSSSSSTPVGPSPLPSATPTVEAHSPDRIVAGPDDRPFVVFDPETKSSTPFERWLEARAKDKMGEHGTKMGLFISTLFNNLPYMMLCCVPLFAFVLKVLYVRRHTFYIDHLIYALHIHTFFYIGIILIVLATIGLNRALPPTLAGWCIALLWIAFVTQIFLSIRQVYRQGWFVSTLKFFTGGFIYLMVLFLALAATFFITLALP